MLLSRRGVGDTSWPENPLRSKLLLEQLILVDCLDLAVRGGSCHAQERVALACNVLAQHRPALVHRAGHLQAGGKGQEGRMRLGEQYGAMQRYELACRAGLHGQGGVSDRAPVAVMAWRAAGEVRFFLLGLGAMQPAQPSIAS